MNVEGTLRDAPVRTARLLLILALVASTICLADDAEVADEPFRIVEREWTEESLWSARQKAGTSAWAEGEVLTFCHRAEADGVFLSGSVQASMERIEESDLWTLSVEIPGLASAILGYSFFDGSPFESIEEHVWRGPDAPEPAPSAETLKGELVTTKLAMPGLDEEREVTVYLPPGHDPKEATPVIYMGDGFATDQYARMLEPAIEAGEIPKTMIVGVHSGGYRGKQGAPPQREYDYRAIEYLWRFTEGLDEELLPEGRFEAHERFFTETVAAWAEETWGASSRREQRGLFGFSNSAAFAVSMAQRHPDRYGFVLPFSYPWGKAAEELPWSEGEAPRHYLVAGQLEPDIHATAREYADELQAAGCPVVFRDRLSGHDGLMWRESFVDAVRWALAPDDD